MPRSTDGEEPGKNPEPQRACRALFVCCLPNNFHALVDGSRRGYFARCRALRGWWAADSQAVDEKQFGRLAPKEIRGLFCWNPTDNSDVSIYDDVYFPSKMQPQDEFEWDEHNEDHIARHGVDRYEAEAVVGDPWSYGRRQGKDRFGNPRFLYTGKTDEGRILVVLVDQKAQSLWRVGMARDAGFGEKKSYRRRLG